MSDRNVEPSLPAPSPTPTPLAGTPVVVAPQSPISAAVPIVVVPAAVPPNRTEKLALGVAALLAAAAIFWVGRPVSIGILLGTLTAFTLQPLYGVIRTRLQRPVLAAVICVALTTLILAAGLFVFVFLLVGRGISRVPELVVALKPGGAVRRILESLGRWLLHLGLNPQRLADQLGAATSEISTRLAGVATAVAGTTFGILLTIFFMLLSLYFILQNWTELSRRAEIMLPLRSRDTRALFEEFRRVGRTVLLGTVLTGLAQGLLATLGYLITGVPEPAVLGALTTLASLLPGVGTLLVWVPAGLYLILTDHAAKGIIELIYGAVMVVAVSDYVIRPRLVNESGKVPALLTFIALFGGIEVFGLVGLILGPVIISLAVAVLRIYEREATVSRKEPSTPTELAEQGELRPLVRGPTSSANVQTAGEPQNDQDQKNDTGR